MFDIMGGIFIVVGLLFVGFSMCFKCCKIVDGFILEIEKGCECLIEEVDEMLKIYI